MLVFLICEAMMFAGLVAAFMLTRAQAGAVWPPPDLPWFPLGETAVNTCALLASAAVVFRASHVWEKPQARIGPLLVGALALGAFFVLLQAGLLAGMVGQGFGLTASQHGGFFLLIVAAHAANVVGALLFMSHVWLRTWALGDEGSAREPLSRDTFLAVRILWYFVAGLWAVLYLCLYL
jgi:cytochrome c oxidase subunit 3